MGTPVAGHPREAEGRAVAQITAAAQPVTVPAGKSGPYDMHLDWVLGGLFKGELTHRWHALISFEGASPRAP